MVSCCYFYIAKSRVLHFVFSIIFQRLSANVVLSTGHAQFSKTNKGHENKYYYRAW